MGGAELLIAIANILTTEADLTEALRLVVREVVRFVGAETGAAYRVDHERRLLVPVAAYRVPHHALSILTTAVLPIDQQGFRDSVFAAASITSSDDVQNDPRFAYELFRRFPHRSGVILPIHLDGAVAAALYLVWWERAERFDLARVAMLEAVGQQVALLLRAARLRAEAQRQRAEALAAEERYHSLVEHIPVGIFRTTPSGQILDANPAMVELLRFTDREELLGINATSLYVNPEDRERWQQLRDASGVTCDLQCELRTHDGGTVWVRLNARSVCDGDREYWEGAVEDITDQRGRLVPIVEASKQIARIITHMGRLTRLEPLDDLPASPMLDLRRSSEPLPK